MEQNGAWTPGRVVPCGVRQDRVPSPDTQKLGNLGSTTWNPTSPEPRRAGVPASPRSLFYNLESLPRDDRTTRENLRLSVGVKTKTNHPLAHAEPQLTGRRRVSGGGWETVRWRQNLLLNKTSASIHICDGETQWPGEYGIPST